jgi:hypothetical protein
VCETFTDLNDPARGGPVNMIFMDKFTDDTNQGKPSKVDSFSFPFFGNVGVPLMVTLYIPGLNVGLLVWLGAISNVSNALDASQLRTLCHGHHVDVPSSTKSPPPPSTFSSESKDTSNRKSKRNRKKKNRKKKSPTSASHVGYRSSTSAIHVEYHHPSSTNHVGGMNLVPTSHTRVQQPTSSSHVGDLSITDVSYVGGKHPTSVIHVGGKVLVTASHNGNRSVASTSHVIDQSPTSVSHVEDVKPATAIHVGGIDYVEKPRWIGISLSSLVIFAREITLLNCSLTYQMYEDCGPYLQALLITSIMRFPQSLFNLWLMKWSCRCNIWLIPFLFWGLRCL